MAGSSFVLINDFFVGTILLFFSFVDLDLMRISFSKKKCKWRKDFAEYFLNNFLISNQV